MRSLVITIVHDRFCFFGQLFYNTTIMDENQTVHTDLKKNGWWRWLPLSWHPYIYLSRLDRPVGSWLLVLPAWWSISLGAENIKMLFFLGGLFTLGAIITRAGGCVINDFWDRKIDQNVARTAERPLAAGTISLRGAACFLLFLGIAGLIILLHLSPVAIYVGLAAIPLVVIYPLTKRFFWFPQAILGLTFSWGVLLGWTASKNTFPDISVFLLYFGCSAWVFGYDTIYAIQDMEDDLISGIKSSAIFFAKRIKLAVATSYVTSIAFLTASFYLIDKETDTINGFSWCGLLLMSIHLVYQVVQIQVDKPSKALDLFQSNRDAGLILAACLILSRLQN